MDLITYNTIKNKKNVVNNYVSYYPYYYCPTPIQREKTTVVKPCPTTHNYSYPYTYYYPYGSYHPYYPILQPIKPKQRPFTTTIITAYDIAVKHGFKGTEQQWIESLTSKINDEDMQKIHDYVLTLLDEKTINLADAIAEAAMVQLSENINLTIEEAIAQAFEEITKEAIDQAFIEE